MPRSSWQKCPAARGVVTSGLVTTTPSAWPSMILIVLVGCVSDGLPESKVRCVPNNGQTLRLQSSTPTPLMRRSERLADDLDPHRVPRRCAQGTVARDQWSVDRLGERDIHRIVRSEIVPQLPGAAEEVHV